ncbi:MAG TPA: hypothetical protein VEX18_01640 [Polyangiaceae bacterium]|nr:hypothetical protein [Polyangiaceae bacterium]
MRLVTLVGMVFVWGCGSSNKAAEKVDPASQDFCLDYANSVCRLAYLCSDASTQDDAFHARYGSSLDDCWQGIEKLCTSNQSGSTVFGPSCGPGKTVNASAMSCIDGLETQTCVEWMTTPAGTGCQGVCSAAGQGGTTGNGGSNGSGTGGGGTAGNSSGGTSNGGTSSGGTSSGPVSTATAFCTVGGELQCERSFECDPEDSAATFGNLAGCKALIQAACTAEDPCPVSFDASLASACIAAIETATCTELMGPAPEICTSACE